MQIGEQDLALTEHLALGRLWLLDLDDQLRLFPHFVARTDARPGGFEDGIGDTNASACAGLHDDIVLVQHQLTNSVGRQPDALLTRLGFARQADQHAATSHAGAQLPKVPQKSVPQPGLGCTGEVYDPPDEPQ